MCRKPRWSVWASSVLVLLGTAAAGAQDPGEAEAYDASGFLAQHLATYQLDEAEPVRSSERRLTELEAEIAALKGRLGQAPPAACDVSCEPCEPCRSSGLYAGYALVFAKPHLKESFRATTLSLLSGTMDLVPFSHGYDSSSRTWLGYVGPSGLGFRARYWQYDNDGNPLLLQSDHTTLHGAHAVTVIFPAQILTIDPGEILSISNGLEVHTVDLEGTQRVQVGCMSVVVGGGLRYASLEQRFTAAITDGGLPEQQLATSRRFEGWGPTASVEMERPLGGCGLALVGGMHGSLLFGSKQMRRVANSIPATVPPIIVLGNADEVVGCAELEIGLQWSRQLENGADLFLRGTYEAQLWTDAGAPTLTFLGFEGFGLAVGLAR